MTFKCELVHWIEPFDICSKEDVLVLEPILNQVLELLHLNFYDDFIDFRLLLKLGSR